MSVCFNMSVSLSVFLSFCFSFCVSSACVRVHLRKCPVNVFACLFVCLAVYLPLSISLSIFLPVCLWMFFYVCPKSFERNLVGIHSWIGLTLAEMFGAKPFRQLAVLSNDRKVIFSGLNYKHVTIVNYTFTSVTYNCSVGVNVVRHFQCNLRTVDSTYLILNQIL